MNLFFLVVCNVFIITCSVCTPRPKHNHKKSPDTVPQPFQKQIDNPTALEVLEQKLLNTSTGSQNHFKKQSSSRRSRRNRRKNNFLKNNFPTTTPQSSAAEHSSLEKKMENQFDFESCRASFGPQSPLCKTRVRPKKTVKRSFELGHKYWDKITTSKQDQSNFEDFFGLFTTNTSTEKSRTRWLINSKLEQSNFEDFFGLFTTNSSTAKSTTRCQIKSTCNRTTSICPKTPETLTIVQNHITECFSSNTVSTVQPLVTARGFNSSLKNNNCSCKVARTVVLPADISKEFHSNTLYLEQVENPRNDVKNFFLQSEDNENQGGENYVVPNPGKPTNETEQLFTLFTESQGDAETLESEPVVHILFESTNEASPFPPTEPSENYLNLVPPSNEKTAMTSPKDKKNCESHSNKKCVCSFSSLKSDFDSIFSTASTAKSALEKVKNIHCRHYEPISDVFVVTSNSKPKEIDKQKKATAVNEENGPKEIDQSSLDEFITQSSSSSEEDDLINVFAGTDLKIPCFPTEGIHLLSSDADNVHYKWTHGNKKPVTEGNVKENSDGEGTLSFDEINIADSDNYTCEVEYINPDTGHLKKESFVHSVSVVSLPILIVHVLVHYKATQCSNSVTDALRRYLPSQVERVICNFGDDKHLCSVDVHNAVCVDSKEQSQTNVERNQREAHPVPADHLKEPFWLRSKRETSKEISFNYEVSVHKRDERLLTFAKRELCDADCHLVIGLKLLQLFRESMREVVSVPLSLNTNNVSGEFNPISSTVKVKYVYGCVEGDFYKGQGFCMACPKHTYSELGAIVCHKCPPHTYQGSMGSSKCIPCSNEWMPACNEYFENTNEGIVVVVAVVILVIILAAVAWYYFGSRERRDANVKKMMVSPSERAKSKKAKVKFGKSQKSIRRKRQAKKESVETELSSLLDSSPSGGEDTDTESSVKR